jgi:hypothetical protein
MIVAVGAGTRVKIVGLSIRKYALRNSNIWDWIN